MMLYYSSFYDRSGWVPCVRSRPARHQRLGYSLRNRQRTIAHLVYNVSIVWVGGVPQRIEGRFVCSGNLWNGPLGLADEVPDGVEPCRRCDVDGIQVAPSVVYLVDTGEALKVGFTKSLTRRVIALNGRLLHQVPGDRSVERQVIEALTDDVIAGREWMHRSPTVRDRAIAAMNAASQEAAA